MTHGLIESKSDTAAQRKLIAQTDQLFVEWMDEAISGYENIMVNFLEMHNTCLNESGMTKLDFRTFRGWIEDYCKLHDWEFTITRPNNKMHVRFRRKGEHYVSVSSPKAFNR